LSVKVFCRKVDFKNPFLQQGQAEHVAEELHQPGPEGDVDVDCVPASALLDDVSIQNSRSRVKFLINFGNSTVTI
jgi:hypothetical protein